ncbi:MAG: hypothetical protein F2690_01910 [Actinobacteria bacterium]|uniref:Unannotated protein n=1 Tax=freshwater metagenome TaxID=449393 RepID=A0A6J6RN97_9ZZZZ|nr:hypothetical protein [Actinomycetota bacterium]MSX71441.1 hypothetical protein [Actinomycetota bacterium]MSY69307.1 hypothetical protein [Actinomycetota bacterium]MTA75310.1 hypothetical protein [Actinomycetota bacterium]
MPFTRTVLGDISTSELGVTYMHEHLIIDSNIVQNQFEHIWLPSEEDAIAEANLCFDAGVRTLVDCMPMGSGGDIKKLQTISKQSSINIIAATGMHTKKYYESNDKLLVAGADFLATKFINDIEVGSQNTDARAGLIKVSSSGEKLTPREKVLFEGAAQAHKVTGAPILTHCEQGTGAIAQIEEFSQLNVSLSNVTISHGDKISDTSYHTEILSSGVLVEYDQCLRQFKEEAPPSAVLTLAMIERGFLSQIMLGTDGARRTLWKSLGGEPGLAWLYSGWSKVLFDVGLTEEDLKALFILNPARALAFKEQSNVL